MWFFESNIIDRKIDHAAEMSDMEKHNIFWWKKYLSFIEITKQKEVIVVEN